MAIKKKNHKAYQKAKNTAGKDGQASEPEVPDQEFETTIIDMIKAQVDTADSTRIDWQCGRDGNPGKEPG